MTHGPNSLEHYQSPENLSPSSEALVNERAAIVLDLLLDETLDQDVLQQAWLDYGIASEEYVESFKDTEQYAVQQIAVIIHKAEIFKDADHTFRYVEELQDAQTYALNQNLDAIVTHLGVEIEHVLSKYESGEKSPEYLALVLRPYLDIDNYEMLREELLDGANENEILGTVYGMLLEQGEDPDELFEKLGLTE